MRQSESEYRKTIVCSWPGMLLLIVTAAFTGSLHAQDGGYSTPNSDQPPFYTPDVEARSTDPERPPAYGPEDAKVRIVLFSDYQCPACRRIGPATQQIASEFPGDVRIEVWHRPLSSHLAAKTAAQAAIAAQKQGYFWEMHDRILTSRGRLDAVKLEEFAREIGLDINQFRIDMDSPEVIERVNEEGALADALGARSTPGWVINGKVGQGWASWGVFRSAVERELAQANALAEEGIAPVQIQSQRAMDNFEDAEKFERYREAVLLQAAAPRG